MPAAGIANDEICATEHAVRGDLPMAATLLSGSIGGF